MVSTQEAPKASKNYKELFHKIEALQGKEKLAFTKTLTTEEKKSYVEHLRERNCDQVTGVFRCFEPLGGMVKFTAMAFDGESPQQYEFYDGQTYTVPKYIAKRLENEFQGVGTWYPTHTHIMDQNGKPIVDVGKKNRRFGFSSLEFQ